MSLMTEKQNIAFFFSLITERFLLNPAAWKSFTTALHFRGQESVNLLLEKAMKNYEFT